jgi:hypothetical protein
MADTNRPVQIGGPQMLRISGTLINTQSIKWLTTSAKVPTGHYWMIDRISGSFQCGVTSGYQLYLNIYSAPLGVHVDSSDNRILDGVTQFAPGLPDAHELVLLDSFPFPLLNNVNLQPYPIYDESKAAYVPENRTIVGWLGVYNLTQSSQPVYFDIQYTDWLVDVPQSTYLPIVETTSDTDE